MPVRLLKLDQSKLKSKWPGRIFGWALFIFIGLPWSLLFVLEERQCDMHIGPPCAVGWGTMKLLNFVIVVGVCYLAGWRTNRLEDRRRQAEIETDR